MTIIWRTRENKFTVTVVVLITNLYVCHISQSKTIFKLQREMIFKKCLLSTNKLIYKVTQEEFVGINVYFLNR